FHVSDSVASHSLETFFLHGLRMSIRPFYNWRKKIERHQKMKNRQIEFTLSSARPNRSIRHRNPRQNRARWWFDRMRQIANSAPDSPPLSPLSNHHQAGL